jgi:hypothetical protein
MVINDIAIFAEPSGYYDFGFQGPAASQLADWSVVSGVWDIDVNDRCLSGQKDSDDNAWFRHRREFAGGDIVVRLRCKVCRPEDNGALFVFDDGGERAANGYAFEIEAGSEERTVRLLRAGSPVATGRLESLPSSAWMRVAYERRGNVLRFCVDGTEILAYRDDHPLTGGRVGFAVTGGVGEPVSFDDIEIYAD